MASISDIEHGRLLIHYIITTMDRVFTPLEHRPNYCDSLMYAMRHGKTESYYIEMAEKLLEIKGVKLH